MLTNFKVLDLTNDMGFLAGKVLGDLGADVIKIERPGGDPARSLGPFYHDIPDPEKSLFWFAYNANKRGITLNIETADGRDIFKRLVKNVDSVVESYPVGYMDSLGLGYSILNEINPRLIMASISPFGQKGPYMKYKGSDIVAMATGGFLYISGDPERPPVGISLPHAYFFGGADAALGIMIAYYYRETSGEGQWIDVSLQQSVAMNLFHVVPWWNLNEVLSKREGDYRRIGLFGGLLLRQTWPCKDGFVIFILTAGAFGVKTNRLLTEWMAEEGMAPDFMKEMDWASLDAAKMTSEFVEPFDEHVGKFFRKYTMKELYDGAVERGMQLYPVANGKQLADSPQLKARDFWTEVEHPELDTVITYPGAWAKMSEAACGIRRRAPLIGEHNQEIYKAELGLSENELITLKQAGVI